MKSPHPPGTPAAGALRLRKAMVPYLMLLPAVLLICCFMLYPIGNVFYLSLRNYVLTKPADWGFVGLGNYIKIFTDDPVFQKALYNSLFWVAYSVVIQTALGMCMALLLNRSFKGRGVSRALIFSPWAVGGILVSIIWGFMYSETNGVLNDILMKIGAIDQGIAWFSTPKMAMAAVIIANVWKGLPFFAVSYLSALQSISPEIYESARVDGAGAGVTFFKITLPLIKDTVLLTTLLRTIWTLEQVDLIFGMTRGGPNNATLTLPLYIMAKFNDSLDMGYASALSGVMALILLLFSAVYLRAGRLGKEETY